MPVPQAIATFAIIAAGLALAACQSPPPAGNASQASASATASAPGKESQTMDPDMKHMAELNEELLEAARAGDIERVQQLHADGADLYATNSWGENSLHLAAWSNNAPLMSWLLDQGLEIDRRDVQFGSTPLHKAAMLGHREAAEVLLDRGADPGVYNNDDYTPMTIAEREGHNSMAEYIRNRTGSQ